MTDPWRGLMLLPPTRIVDDRSIKMKSDFENKAAEIGTVLNQNRVDTWALRELALTDGGLVNDEIRKRAWPLLVGVHLVQSGSQEQNSAPIVPCSDDFEIIRWDAARSWHLLSRQEREQKSLLEHMRDPDVTARIRFKERALVDLVNTLLVQHSSEIFYYQGLHELASLVLNTLCAFEDEEGPHGMIAEKGTEKVVDLTLPLSVLSQLARSHWKDLLTGDFSLLENALKLTLFPLLAKLDPQLHEALNECEIHPSLFVSWVVTWFSREIRDTDLVKRLFDFFLVSHPLMPVYVTVAMLTHSHNRRLLLDECDSSELFALIRELPKLGTSEISNTHRSVSVTHHEDPFTESDGSTESDSACSMNDRSKTLASLENVLHEILDKSELHDRAANESEEKSTDSTFASADSAVVVPFQEVLDLALEYMERIPPSHIEPLAARFYGAEEFRLLTSRVNEISMFDSPVKKEDLPRTISIDPLAEVSLGYGDLLDKKRFRKSIFSYRLLELVALLIFVFTVLAMYHSLRYQSPVPQTRTDSERVDAPPVRFASTYSQSLKCPATPTTPPLQVALPPPTPPPHVTELLNSASRFVVDNAVSTSVRSYASEVAAATWSATASVVSRALESESLLDLDASEEPGSVPAKSDPTGLPPSSKLISDNCACWNNETWTQLLLNSASRMVVNNPVSTSVRSYASEAVAATWNATAKLVSRVLETEPPLDLDSGVHADSTSDPSSSTLISNSSSNPCLKNYTWANLLLSSRGSLSLIYCLASLPAKAGTGD